MAKDGKTGVSTAYLLLGVVFWGGSFSFIKESVAAFDIFSFVSIRFLIASVVVALIFIRRFRNYNLDTFRKGVLLGVILGFSFVFQTLGIKYTTASNAGFITGLSVVLVPAAVAFIDKKMPGGVQIASVAAAFIGLALLTFRLPFSVNKGDLWVLLCAVTFAAHIIMIGRMTKGLDALTFSVTQSMAVVLVAGAMGLMANGGIDVPRSFVVWRGVLFCAVFATAFTYTAQAHFQRNITEIKAAIIYALEPVFAAIIAHFYLGEKLTGQAMAGGALILAGMILSEVKIGKKRITTD